MSHWRPLLSGSLANQALGVVEEIARDLQAPLPSPSVTSAETVSLASGLAGKALFFAYLDRALPKGGWGDPAAEALDQAIESLAGTRTSPGLYSGFTGVAWVLEHLQGWFLDESDDPGEEVAAAVERTLRAPWRDFDLIQGLAGLGVWALARLPRSGAEECLRRIVARLTELAERRDGTAAWRTPADRVPEDRSAWFPQGFFFTGVAHGTAGVISLLAEAQAAGVESRPLLDMAVRWLLAQKMVSGERSVFPYETADVVAPDAPIPRPAHLAWCHGDPGIAAALLVAAKRAGEPAWEHEAVALAREAAARSPSDRSVVDAGLCHGSGGLLHLFNRMYQATGDPALAEAARFWFDRTLALRRPGEGVAGFLSWETDPQGTFDWRAETGFLSGAAGVGLALLAAASPVEPDWDHALLVSIPPQESLP
jgi:lantibiotic modifying enzyme